MMELQTPRSKATLFFAVVITVASAIWLATSMWGADNRTLQTLIGLVGIGTGLFLLLAPKSVLAPNPPIPATPAAAAIQHGAWKRFRLLGLAAILMSAAQLFAGDTITLILVTCAAAVSIAAWVGLPRRFFAPPSDVA